MAHVFQHAGRCGILHWHKGRQARHHSPAGTAVRIPHDQFCKWLGHTAWSVEGLGVVAPASWPRRDGHPSSSNLHYPVGRLVYGVPNCLLQGDHNATIMALVKLSAPDTPILLLAFTAGAAAALGQALIPYYTGPGRLPCLHDAATCLAARQPLGTGHTGHSGVQPVYGS